MNPDNISDDILSNMSQFEISDRDKKLTNEYTIKVNVPHSACVINHTDECTTARQNSCTNNPSNNSEPRIFPTIPKMVVRAVKRNLLSMEIDDTNEEDDTETDSPRIPTMDEVLKKAKRRHGINLDPKQTRAFEMLCTTFMIKIINNQRTQFVGSSDPEQTRKVDEVIECLKSMGGKDQLIMFLTGPAGAGKTTAIKLAQTFCEKFSEACNIPFDQYSFYFTAYTGTAASEFGGTTTLTAL
jgi:flagellar biosynthesis GTPase FlhF